MYQLHTDGPIRMAGRYLAAWCLMARFGVQALTFAGKQLGAGTYTLFVIPNKDSWTIILNRKLGQWGAFDYDKVKDGDIIHADVPVKSATSPVEQFTIDVNNGGFNMSWDKTSVFVPVKPY